MKKGLNILFLTNFDEASYQAIPAVAHLLAEIRSTLTILHVYKNDSERDEAEQNVQSFFAEAEHYPGCRRLALQGQVEEVAESYCKNAGIDLVVAPSVRRLEIPRPFRTSTRSGLLDQIPAPLWTMTARVNSKIPYGPIKHVGCYVNFSNGNLSHVHAAVQMARHLRAKLQVLCVTPTINEGTMLTALDANPPVHGKVAEQRLTQLINSLSPDAGIFVETGDEGTEVPYLAKKSKCDILFLGEGHALTKLLTGHLRLKRYISRLPCPAVCFDGASATGARWMIEPSHADQYFELHTPTRQPVAVRAIK